MSNTKHKTLEVEVLNIHKGEYLSEVTIYQFAPVQSYRYF